MKRAIGLLICPTIAPNLGQSTLNIKMFSNVSQVCYMNAVVQGTYLEIKNVLLCLFVYRDNEIHDTARLFE